MPELDASAGLLFSFMTPEDLEYYYYEPPWNWIGFQRESYATQNVYYLGPLSINARGFMFKFPVRTLDDLKGRKIRAYGKLIDFMTIMGAQPIFLPTTEVYTALATGQVEGATLGPAITWLALKFYDVGCKYISQPYPEAAATQEYIINMKAWESLPDDIKAILHNWVRRSCAEFWIRYYMEDNLAIKELVEQHGCQVVTLPESEVKKASQAAQQIWDKIAEKGPRPKKAIDTLREYMKWRGYM
jgi:TRAP-type mannitol/chloroaromatic compound transport system substrate-binding protein